jgi:hypothetical protein
VEGDDMDWDREKRDYLDRLFVKTGVRLELEGRRESKWARGAGGALAILSSREHAGPHWWFGLKESEFTRRRALGVVLLCQGGQDILDFPIAASVVEEFLAALRPDSKGESKLHLFLRHGRYVLPVPGRPDVDLTPMKGDLSWLSRMGSPTVDDERDDDRRPTAPSGSAPRQPDAAFFARVRKGLLEPLDATGLSDGDVVMVTATVARQVPGSAALRRIVARGGPASLPPDFAEQHDHYAHGAARR